MGNFDQEREDQHYHPLHEHESNYRVVGPRVKEDHPCSICRVVHFMKTNVTTEGTKVDFVFNVGDQEEHICRDLGVKIDKIPTIDYGCTYCLEHFWEHENYGGHRKATPKEQRKFRCRVCYGDYHS